MKSKAQEQITKALGPAAAERFNNPVRLAFRWYEPNRNRDIDNICFAKKFILDTLVNTKIIETDSWRGVQGFTDNFYIDKDNPRIEVDILEVNE